MSDSLFKFLAMAQAIAGENFNLESMVNSALDGNDPTQLVMYDTDNLPPESDRYTINKPCVKGVEG